MTFPSAAQRSRAVAPNSGLMKTPDYLTDLVHRDMQPVAWREKCEQAARLNAQVREHERRKKLAKVERIIASHHNDKKVLHLLSPLRAQRLLWIFCRLTGCEKVILTSKNKTTMVVKWRHMVMWIIRKNTGQSYNQIAKVMGIPDHATVMYGFKRIENTPDLKREAKEIERAVLAFERETYGGATQ